jgi:hypothetical protein
MNELEFELACRSPAVRRLPRSAATEISSSTSSSTSPPPTSCKDGAPPTHRHPSPVHPCFSVCLCLRAAAPSDRGRSPRLCPPWFYAPPCFGSKDVAPLLNHVRILVQLVRSLRFSLQVQSSNQYSDNKPTFSFYCFCPDPAPLGLGPRSLPDVSRPARQLLSVASSSKVRPSSALPVYCFSEFCWKCLNLAKFVSFKP